jgi:transcriptional regulator with XRE-family HTH domain
MLVLDTELLQRIVERRFRGNQSEIPRHWPVPFPPHKSSISRWLRQEKFPHGPDELFGLAGALDVDPLLLLRTLPGMSFSTLCRLVADQAWSAEIRRPFRDLWFLQQLLRPGPEWPAADIAQKYYRRD